MNRRHILSLSVITALGVGLLPGRAIAQQEADIEGVKAASKAFYTALAKLDGGEAMACWNGRSAGFSPLRICPT